MLDADNAAFIQTGVSISLATCGADRLPNLIRGLGCKLLAGGQRVGIFVSASLASAVFRDIRANRRLAGVFSLPSSNRTLQLKGDDAEVLPFDPADLPIIDRHIAAFYVEVAPEGVPEAVVRTVFSYRPDDLAMVVFSPSAAFSQTPGPKAGQSIGGAA
jgi:hypothetical protein